MDRRQRVADTVEQFRTSFEGMQSDVWTAIPGVIDAVDLDKQTCTVQPSVMCQVTGQDGETQWIEIPLLLDVPIFFPTGGGFTLTFPVTAGDECLVVFASRCVDNWWAQEGDTGPSGHARSQAELRMHSLSDGFAFVGFRNQTRLVSDISTTDVQLRQDAGTAVISIRQNAEIYAHSDTNIILDADGHVTVQADGDVNVTATGNIVANCDNLTATAAGSASITAAVAVEIAAATITLEGVTSIVGNMNIIGTLSLNGVPFDRSHVHSGVSTGTHNTGPVV